MEWLNKLIEKYPTPDNPNNHFTDEDIAAFEKALGTSLPADYYAFLKAYGYGTFGSYIYINYPFNENDAQIFIDEQEQREENYKSLESDYTEMPNGKPVYLDCKFNNGEPEVTGGNADLLEFMRCEEIDSFTRSKIIAFGNHYPYPFYPKDGGLIFIGWTDDEEFFLRKTGDKFTVVTYDCGYYEFDMSFTEFLYNFMTMTLKLPMMWDEMPEWEFEPYYDTSSDEEEKNIIPPLERADE